MIIHHHHHHIHHHHDHHKNIPSSFIIITIAIQNHHHPIIINRWTTQTTSTLPACSPLSWRAKVTGEKTFDVDFCWSGKKYFWIFCCQVLKEIALEEIIKYATSYSSSIWVQCPFWSTFVFTCWISHEMCAPPISISFQSFKFHLFFWIFKQLKNYLTFFVITVYILSKLLGSNILELHFA